MNFVRVWKNEETQQQQQQQQHDDPNKDQEIDAIDEKKPLKDMVDYCFISAV